MSNALKAGENFQKPRLIGGAVSEIRCDGINESAHVFADQTLKRIKATPTLGERRIRNVTRRHLYAPKGQIQRCGKSFHRTVSLVQCQFNGLTMPSLGKHL
jgi:hypothetical protein